MDRCNIIKKPWGDAAHDGPNGRGAFAEYIWRTILALLCQDAEVF